MISIQRLLTSTLVGLITASLAASLVWSYYSIRHEVEEVFDAELAQYARLLRQSWESPPNLARPLITNLFDTPETEMSETAPDAATTENRESGPWGHAYERKIAFQIWRNDNLLARSSSAPENPWGPSLHPGYHNVVVDDREWRVFFLLNDDVWIGVGERIGIRDEISREMLSQGIAPALLAIVLVSIIVTLVVRYGLAPLSSTAKALRTRRPENLTPLAIQRAPSEVKVVVQAINQLFERLREAIQRERSFTADAAHELRTPIAAIKVHLQNARRARNAADARDSLTELEKVVTRTEGLIEELLTLSRLDQDSVELPMADVPLRALIQNCWNDLELVNREQQLELHFTGENDPHLTGNRETLGILFTNLLRNAIQYAPAGTPLTISIAVRAASVDVAITDRGPGIAPDLRARVMERFYRADMSKLHYNDGTGLGLAIVQRIAAIHHASVRLADAPTPPGLRVILSFPSVQS